MPDKLVPHTPEYHAEQLRLNAAVEAAVSDPDNQEKRRVVFASLERFGLVVDQRAASSPSS
jgi:hypothetical protein